MKRSTFLKMMAGSVAVAYSSSLAAMGGGGSANPAGKGLKKVTKTSGGKRPNILFIMTDEQRFDQFGRMTNGYFETPNLDRLAESGVIFNNASSTCTVCVPARKSLITGLYPHRFPMMGGRIHTPMAEGHWTLPHALRAAGYRTAHIGKGHYHPVNARHGFDLMLTAEHLHTYGSPQVDDYTRYLIWQGIADWKATGIFGSDPDQREHMMRHVRQKTADPFPYHHRHHITDWVARETINFLEKRDPDQPYFCMTSFPTPHTPYNPPAPYDTMYDPAEERVPVDDFDEINQGMPPVAFEMLDSKQRYGYGYEKVRDLGDGVMNLIHCYIRALCKQIDDAVGEILEHVDLSDTVVIFTTDHGDYSGRRGLIYKCPFLPFEDLARVPFFMSGAGISPGVVTDLVQNFDLTPTCLELAGVDGPAGADFDARSLTPFMGGRGSGADDRVVYCANQEEYDMVRRGDIKYFRHRPSGEEMLFDLLKDPRETENRVGEAAYAEALRDLRHEFDRVLSLTPPVVPKFAV